MKSFFHLVVPLCVIASPLLFGQFETGEVLGTVHDPSGAGIPGVTVTLTNQETGIKEKTSTEADGSYDFFNVKLGRYTLDFEHAGFSKTTTEDVIVDVNARQRVDVTLQIGEITQAVSVTGAASILETDSSEQSQVINTQEITELPLNGRAYADLALLSGNTIKSPMSDAFAPGGTPREGAFNVNGMRSTYNNFLLDGVDNNAYGTSNQGFSSQAVQPSPDAIAEFKLITSNYSAEYGRVGGAVVNAVMRSGTNQLHGTAYEFLRNTALNAGGFEFAQPYYKPPLQRNQFGASIGGPFIKNKLFFFGDYEGYRQLQHNPNFDSIPTVAERNGVLPYTVQNPLTGQIYPAGTPIPVASLNPFAAAVLNALPAPNAGSSSSISNNYQALLLYRDYSDKYDAKVDGQINDRMSTFLRWSQRKDIYYQQPSMPGFAGGDGNGYIHAIQQNASWGYTWTVDSTSILEARLGFTHVLAGKEPPNLGGPSLEQLFGIQGLPTTPNIAGGLNSQTISGFTSFGRQTSNPQFQNPTSWDPKVDYSKTLGHHSLKVGYEYLLIHTEVLDTNPLYGQDTFSGQFSKPCPPAPASCAAIPSTSAAAASYNLADFIFGTPSVIAQGSYEVVNLRQYVHSLYAQDDWRVTPKLTVNLGLRWDFATPLYTRDNNWSNFDPATDTMIQATGGSLYNRSLVHPDYKDFGPRLGMAYSVDPKTVVRSGYGISYSFFNRPGSAMEGINAPDALFGVLSQSIPYGGPVPTHFLNTVNSFTTGIANPAAFKPLVSNVDYIPANTRWPYIQNWFVSVQRQLTKDTVLEAAYNGSHSLRLPIIADYNQAVPTANGLQVPIPSFGPITWADPAGDNDYEGLSVRLEHRFAKGLYLLNSFAWGKALGDSEQALEYFPTPGFGANPQNIYDLAAERGPSSYDIKLNNVTTVVYQLPFGKGRALGSNWNPVLNAIAGGWELTAINSAHTGQPIDIAYYTVPSAINVTPGLSNDYRGQSELRPNVSGSGIGQSEGGMVHNYFAGYTFTEPTSQNPFGNLGRDAFRAPSLEQWDLGADKNFHIAERFNLQFRSEFFNILNKTNFLIPDPRVNDASFGTITSTFPPRQIQFGLKLLF
jgi:hypothetical protein